MAGRAAELRAKTRLGGRREGGGGVRAWRGGGEEEYHFHGSSFEENGSSFVAVSV